MGYEEKLRESYRTVVGKEPPEDPRQAKRELERFIQTEGAKVRDPRPCHCYDHCEDDDDGAPRRPLCRLRE